jgi:hypothetical protein
VRATAGRGLGAVPGPLIAELFRLCRAVRGGVGVVGRWGVGVSHGRCGAVWGKVVVEVPTATV